MRTRIVFLCLMLALGAAGVAAQTRTVNYEQMYCSGIFSTEAVPYDTYLVSGHESGYQTTFQQGDYVHINRGSSQGVSVGDEFLVLRPVKDTWPQWFYWERGIRSAIGKNWKDIGKLRVVNVHSDMSTAEIVFSCDYMQRGDHVRPFTERQAPALRSSKKFDRWAPPSGRATAMVVAGRDYGVVAGTGNIIYVNLGSSDGVKVGDYFRAYQYQGTRHDTVYQHRGIAYKAYGFGRTPRPYKWDEIPREVLGEGVVLRVSPTASTVLITYALREIYLGDYVELEHPQPVEEAPPAPPPAPANQPPTMSCSVERSSVIAGERVRVTARASDPDNDTLAYAWRTNGGQIVGSGSSVMLDTTNLRPARYTVTAQVNDGRGGAADCDVNVDVQAAPPPAQASKVNECIFRVSSAGVDNVCKRILDDVAIRLKNDPRSTLVIVGYADPGESGAARLATQRGENARQYLLASGIADARVDVRTASGQTGAGRQNRRIDLIWVPAGASY